MKTQRGYTLTEMLVVIAIVGIFSLVSVPAFMSFSRSNLIKASNRQVVADLRNLRQACISRGVRGKMTFNTGSGARQYQMFLQEGGGGWSIYPVNRPLPRMLETPVYFLSTTFVDSALDADSAPDVVFNPNGTVDMTDIDPAVTPSLVIKVDWKIPFSRYTISANLAGQVTSVGAP